MKPAQAKVTPESPRGAGVPEDKKSQLEAAPDAMVVVNQAGEIVLLNTQAEKQFGYHREELLGQRVNSIIPNGFPEGVIASQLRSAADALATQIGVGIELTGLRKDGSDFPIELRLSPMKTSGGFLITAAVRDIGGRKTAIPDPARMEAKYRRLWEGAPDAMVVVDKDEQIVLMNVRAEKQFGYLREELIGQKMTKLIPLGWTDELRSDGLKKIGVKFELSGRRKDGTRFPIEVVVNSLEGAEGILVTASIRDVAKHKASI